MQLPGFEDLEEIGRGGFAVVYRARQTAFGRQVAIKVLTSPGLTEEDLRRFEREALAMGQLSWHPNIVVVHQAGVTDTGHPHLVMEFLEGGSLGDQVRRRGRLTAAEALDHGVRLAGALQTAHDAGLLHRDVKPDNALVDAFGRVKLADFGIAAVTGHTVTATGVIAGTIAHAAPEVLTGGRASTASDVYSLGSTLYELLTGQPAFLRATDESIAAPALRATTEPAPDLRPLGVPDAVAAVVESAMAKDPDRRPPGAAAFGRDLQQAQRLVGAPTTELPVRPVGPVSTDTVTGPAPSTERPAAPGTVVAEPSVPVPGGPDGDPAGKPRRGLVVGLLAAALVAVGAWFGAQALGGDDDAPGPASGDGPTVASIPVGRLPQGVAATSTAVWVANSDDDTVTRIDPATNRSVETVAVGNYPEGVAATDTAVWVANRDDDTVSRIDPTDDRVTATITVGPFPRGIAATDTAVWVTNKDDATVSRIDPATDQVTATIPVGTDPLGVAATDTTVWVTNRGDDTVSRIDPATDQVTATIEVGDLPRDIAASDTTVWVTNREGDTVTRIDPADNRVTAVMSLGTTAWGVAADGDQVWVTNLEDDTVTRIDPVTGQVADIVDVGDEPGSLTVTSSAVWVADRGDDTVSRITIG